VVHITDSASRLAGGISESMRGLTTSIEQSGRWRNSILAIEDRASNEDRSSWGVQSLDFVKRSAVGPFGSSWAIRKHVAHIAPDIVHLHGIWGPASLAARYICSQKSKPVIVISPHGMLEPWALQRSRLKKSIAWNVWMRSLIAQTDCFHALCDEEADSIRKFSKGVPIVVIPNGVNAPDSVPDFAGRRKEILFLGRLHVKKGLSSLLSAWASLSDIRDDGWRLIIAGWDDGGFEATLRAESARLGLDQSVVFYGPAYGAAKADLLGKCSVFVLPSSSEGLPMSVLEAWSFGMPVLMTRECHLREGFDAKAAISIESDAPSIADGLNLLVTQMSRSERCSMGARGRELIETRFSWGRIGREMADAYDAIIRRGPAVSSHRTAERTNL
jgi:glycosyltransferase involved in cell wall biosynthesis